MSETITFEYGAREVARFEGGTHVEASLKSQDELAKEYPGFDIKLLPYDSIHTPLSGGRQLLDLQPLDYLGIADLIRSYNQRGIPFMVPFNGGTSLHEVLELIYFQMKDWKWQEEYWKYLPKMGKDTEYKIP